MTRRQKPTPTQRKILENLAAGRASSHGMPPGRSHAGGWDGAIMSLHRRGWINRDGITDAGRQAIAP